MSRDWHPDVTQMLRGLVAFALPAGRGCGRDKTVRMDFRGLIRRSAIFRDFCVNDGG